MAEIIDLCAIRSRTLSERSKHAPDEGAGNRVLDIETILLKPDLASYGYRNVDGWGYGYRGLPPVRG